METRESLFERAQREWAEGAREGFDTCHCPNCGERRKSLGEVRQEERQETCLYVCTACSEVVDESPF